MTSPSGTTARKSSQHLVENQPVFNQQEFISRLRDSLRKAELQTSQIRKTNNGLFFSGLVSSGAATLVAGITSAMGPLVGDGVTGWRLACIVAAFFGFISTIVMGLMQQLRLNDRLVENQQYLGRLRALDFSITSGSQNWTEIAREYTEILRSFPEALN
jgi:hypothetical protein